MYTDFFYIFAFRFKMIFILNIFQCVVLFICFIFCLHLFLKHFILHIKICLIWKIYKYNFLFLYLLCVYILLLIVSIFIF